MPRLTLLMVTLLAVSGCADDAARPTTYRELCEQNATIDCDYASRKDVCAGRAVQPEATCAGNFVAQCCALAGDCEARVAGGTPATFADFDACNAAVLELSCEDVGNRTMPAQCAGVVK